MKVIARAGVRVPKENAPRQYITDEEEVTVPDTMYYTRRLIEGDLIDASKSSVDSEADASAVSAGDKKTAKGA